MGMTIEEHIEQLKKLKSFHNGSYGASINFALDTIRKYQKIEEISKMSTCGIIEKYKRINGVIKDGEDGNVD